MTNGWSVFPVACMAAVGMFLFSGCRSDAYYHNRAAERAREYLLKEAKELSAEERYFVTFNDPVFLTSAIIGSTEFEKERSIDAPMLNDQLLQICISWKIPGRDEWYLVYGASNGRMDFWYPDRLVRKKFAISQVSGLERAAKSSQTYAMDNLFDQMDTAEQNFIRFHFPAVYETNFAPNFDPTGKGSAESIAEAKKRAANSIQYSLIWEMPGKKEAVVFCGLGGPEMNGWNINFAGMVPADELRRHTVRIIKTPEEFYRKFPERYTASGIKNSKGKK